MASWLAILSSGLYAYGTIFICMLLVALVMPEEPALLAWGLAVGAWQLNPLLAVIAAVAGVLATDAGLYLVGRFGGRHLVLRLGLTTWLSEQRRLAIQRGFCQSGVVWLITARLLPIPGLRTGVFLSAGILRYPWWRFVLSDAAFLGLVGTILMLGGYYYAEAMGRWLQEFDTIRYWLALSAALVIGGGLAWVGCSWLGCKLSSPSFVNGQGTELATPTSAVPPIATPTAQHFKNGKPVEGRPGQEVPCGQNVLRAYESN